MNSETGTYQTIVDPYRDAFYLAAYRLRYDLDFKFWPGRKRIKQLHNNHTGKCVILCNGPSLNSVDFDLLKESKVFTIGLNKINLMFDRTDFRPDLICAVNPFVVQQNVDFFLNTNIPLFLDYLAVRKSGGINQLIKRPNINVLYSSGVLGQFSTNLAGGICQGYTVTYVALQVAFYLGFTEVALVGCDHSFSSTGLANSTITQQTTENNHFILNYFPPGSQWQLPDLAGSEFHYEIAREVYKAKNRTIYNATDGGKLEVFQRLTLEDFLR